MTDYNNNEENQKPDAYRIEDDHNLEEKDLKKGLLSGEEKDVDAEGMEGKGMGGHRFGEESNTPSGDDENNPSRTAGYRNEYFRRTEPSDEHPENNNFKDPNQEGEPDYHQGKEDTNPNNG